MLSSDDDKGVLVFVHYLLVAPRVICSLQSVIESLADCIGHWLFMLQLSLTETPSIVALHIVRSCGALCVGEAVIALQAPGFLHPRDKHALFATRIVVSIISE